MKRENELPNQLILRNIDGYTMLRLNEMAKKAGMTREAFLRQTIKNIVLAEEIRSVEDKYTTLVRTLSELIEVQGEVIERNNMFLESLKESNDV